MHVSVVTTCTREKAATHRDHLLLADFAAGKGWVARREKALGHLMLPAGIFYTGLLHRRLMAGVQVFREATTASSAAGRADLHILSAGYGLIGEHRHVAPYDCTFKGMSASEIRTWGEFLGIPGDMRGLLASPADLRLVLLTHDYLRAWQPGPDVSLGAPTIFVVSTGQAVLLRACGAGVGDMRTWEIRRDDVSRFRTPGVALRGEIGARVLRLLASRGRGAVRDLCRARDFRPLLLPPPADPQARPALPCRPPALPS